MEKVTEERAMEMLGVLPPAVWYKTGDGEIFQVGEAVDAEGGQFRYDTYEKRDGQWYATGAQHRHTPEKSEIIMSNSDC